MGSTGAWSALTADTPVAFLDFIDLEPSDAAEPPLITDHRIGDFGDDLFLLFGREYVLIVYVYEWRWLLLYFGCGCFDGSFVPLEPFTLKNWRSFPSTTQNG